jgi:fructose-bisphosphate aldolase class I
MNGALADLVLDARELVAPGKGVLAADDSPIAIARQFRAVGLEPTQENRRAYREMLFTTPGLETYFSGALLSDEAIRQSTSADVPFVELLTTREIMPGVRADEGPQMLEGLPGEPVAGGIEHLGKRLQEYRHLGAWFATWRARCAIGHGIPTETCIRTNAVRLAHFAALAQQTGLVPIVDTEVLTEGDHSASRCREITAHALETLIAELYVHQVQVEGMIIGISMVVPGLGCPVWPSPADSAAATLHCLLGHVPRGVPGVVISAGGLPEDAASVYLDEIDRTHGQPWQVSFMFGPGLQTSALRAWALDPLNARAAQDVFQRRASMIGAARHGWPSAGVAHLDAA